VPGFIVNVIVAVAVSLLTKAPDIETEFDEAAELAAARAF